MRIELITQQQYNTLISITESNPALIYQNKGYDNIAKSSLTDSDKDAILKVSKILKESIKGFCSFQNFRLSKKGDLEVRFQYNYNYDGGIPFEGVGYIKVIELLNGFDQKNK